MERKLKGSYRFAQKRKGQLFCNIIKGKSNVPFARLCRLARPRTSL